MSERLKTTHNLEFYERPWKFGLYINSLWKNKGKKCDTYKCYKVGTCHGLYTCSDKSFKILAIMNNQPGNGHLDDVLEHFEHSAKKYGYSLLIEEVWNKNFERHLITKRGFKKIKKGCIKYFR